MVIHWLGCWLVSPIDKIEREVAVPVVMDSIINLKPTTKITIGGKEEVGNGRNSRKHNTHENEPADRSPSSRQTQSDQQTNETKAKQWPELIQSTMCDMINVGNQQ